MRGKRALIISLLGALALLVSGCLFPQESGPEEDVGGKGGGGKVDGGGGGGGGEPTRGWSWANIPQGMGSISAIRFIDGQRGWLACSDWESGAYYTADGGQTWELKRGDFTAMDVNFTPDGQLVLVGGSGSPNLWVSEDYGEHFEPIRTLSDFVGEVSIWDRNRMAVASETGERISFTGDGGETWERQEFDRGHLPGVADMWVEGESLWLVGGPAFINNGTGANIEYSPDGGATWQYFGLLDEAHDWAGGELEAIYVQSPTDIWVAGFNRQIYHTTDNFQTSVQIKDLPAEITNFHGIAFDGDHGIAGAHTSSGGIAMVETFDGGASWEITFTEACNNGCGIEGVTFAGPGVAFAFGYNATMLRYQAE